MVRDRVRIYTDGGCRPNPGPGGWGAVLLFPGDEVRELAGAEGETTNNRMELTAALRALEALPPGTPTEVVTDSTYVKQGITQWVAGWRRRGWVTAGKEPVKNQDLWRALDAEVQRHDVRWSWVRGHAGDRWNERAHELAAAAIPGGAASPAAVEPLADREAVHAFVGVAWSGKRREGAWGAVLCWQDRQRELSGRVAGPSPNAAHVVSAAEALASLRRPLPTHLYTVSDYLRDGASRWLPAWQRRGWRTREGDPVANRREWERLSGELQRIPVTWHVVSTGDAPPELERARDLARAALVGKDLAGKEPAS